jgi:LCP family protein required for cell wall assembly
MRLLVIGLTLPIGGEVMGADAIRLVTIDFDHASATILAMPAVLWVPTPVLSDLGLDENYLTNVYEEVYSQTESNSERFRHLIATQAMAQTILDNFGFAADHYLTVDERAFIKSVDILGGIQIDLPQAVDGSEEGYGFYPEGVQTLDGMRALNFARLFHPSGVTDWDFWGNLQRQNLVVKSIFHSALKPKNWTKIPSLVQEVKGAVYTDLSINQALDLACMVEAVDENTRMVVVDETMIQRDSSGRMIPDLSAIQGLISGMGGGGFLEVGPKETQTSY